MRIGLAISLLFWLGVFLLVTGCTYNPYMDRNIIYPVLWYPVDQPAHIDRTFIRGVDSEARMCFNSGVS